MKTAEPYRYAGDELGLFRHARNWKAYFGRQLRPYIRGDVLEVGAGMGSTTLALCRPPAIRWTCLEPDPALVQHLLQTLGRNPPLDPSPEVVAGTITELPEGRCFDTILYIDVVEHILDDRLEVHHAATRLRLGGRLVILAPAHPWLFTPFDHAIGHHRRYNRVMFAALEPPSCKLVRSFYLDSCGLLASLGNLAWLRSTTPQIGQIHFWDRVLVRLSRATDPLLFYRIGKSIIGVWQKIESS